MTLELPATGTRAPGRLPEVRWMSPAAGLWVASRHSEIAGVEHAGMVERLDGRYHARSARGRELGSFDDLASARAALALTRVR